MTKNVKVKQLLCYLPVGTPVSWRKIEGADS